MKLSTLATSLSVLLILFLSGCGSKPTPKSKEDVVVDATLAQITLTKHGLKTGMKSIALEWNSITDKRVRGIYLYKVALDVNNTKKDTTDYLDTIDNRFSTHYLDTDIKPNSRYTYYFKTYSENAEGLQSKTIIAQSKPILDSVTWLHVAKDMPRSAKIIWRPHTNKLVNGYEIQRRTLEEKKFETIVKLKNRLRVEYIDNDLKDKHTYIYRIRALTYNNIVSKPSKEMRVTTKALPSQVLNIKATTDRPKAIFISWEKTKIKDFSNYRVYRSKKLEGGYKLIAEITKNRYTDKIQEDGMTYFYRVSTIDKDLLESKHNLHSAQGVTLVKPSTPVMIEAKVLKGKVILKWSKTDERTKSYIVSKRYKKSMFDEVIDEFDGITTTVFEDSKIKPSTVYYYKIYSVDKNNIRSDESIEFELETKNEIKVN